MPNLINPNENNEDQFQPHVNNINIKTKISDLWIIIWYVSFILLFPLIIHIIIRNKLLRTQLNINNSASLIDVQLQKRRDTLIKLVDATQSYVKYEKSILKDLTEIRKSTFQKGTGSEKLSSLSSRIFAVAENYPQLKTDSLARETMEQATYLEAEIAAARRLYNSEVTLFNAQLLTLPSNIIASIMQLSTMPLFKISSDNIKDVKLTF